MNLEAQLARIEGKLSRALLKVAPSTPKGKRMPEKEASQVYEVSPARLKQLRYGCHKNGKYYPPKIFKWGHRNGRRIDYDVEELNQVFKRTIVGMEA